MHTVIQSSQRIELSNYRIMLGKMVSCTKSTKANGWLFKSQNKEKIGERMKTQKEAVEELSLLLMYLTRFQDNNEFCRYMELAWKGYDFGALNQ